MESPFNSITFVSTTDLSVAGDPYITGLVNYERYCVFAGQVNLAQNIFAFTTTLSFAFAFVLRRSILSIMVSSTRELHLVHAIITGCVRCNSTNLGQITQISDSCAYSARTLSINDDTRSPI
jgi:hypothetical protein